MTADVTLGAIKRITYDPDDNRNGTIIGGQDHWNVNFTGGSINNVTLTDCTITIDAIDNTRIGANIPSTGVFTTLTATTITANSSFIGNVTGNITGNLTGNVTGNVSGSAGSVAAGNIPLSTTGE